MPYDTTHLFQETTQEHTRRLKRSQRWTKIRRRALLLKLDDLDAGEVRQRMGASNCPYALAETPIDTLMAELAVTYHGRTLVPEAGAEPDHDLAHLEDQVQDFTRTLAGDSSKLDLARAGVVVGHPAHGYERQGSQRVRVAGVWRDVPCLVINPVQATVVVLLFEQYTDHDCSFAEIAADLNAQGYRTHKGKRWTADTLRDMLRNPIYTGHVLYRGTGDRNRRHSGTLYPGLHPAIISWADYCRAQDVRVQRHPHKPQAHWTCPWQIGAGPDDTDAEEGDE